MDDCAACGTRLEEGITKCPQCDADLVRPGAFRQVFGWVTVLVSLIPMTVGAVTVQQRSYLPLAVGVVLLIGGLTTVILGRMRMARSPVTIRPSRIPAMPPPAVSAPGDRR